MLDHQQMLWVLSETIAKAGAMDVFAEFEPPDGGKSLSCLHFFPGVPFACDLRSSELLVRPPLRSQNFDMVIPPLGGTILPGVMRASVLAYLFRNYLRSVR